MDSVLLRLIAQVALSTWAITEIAMLLFTRKQAERITGTRWAVFGLICFAVWMFLLSISIFAVAVIPRGDLVGVFVVLELGSAIGAWGWLIANARLRFRIASNGQNCSAAGK